MVGNTDVSQQKLAGGHKQATLVYGLLMEAITDYNEVEFRLEQAMSPSGAWEVLLDVYMPPTLAARHSA